MEATTEQQQLPIPVTRIEKILMAIYDKTGSGGYASPDQIGQVMAEYAENNPEFWGLIPDGTITRAMLANEIPEQIRDETLREIDAEEVNHIFDSVFHNN